MEKVLTYKSFKRDPFFDNVKILLMLLVVFGHIVPPGQGKICLASFEWVYSFHMPLFVFISGYFTNVENRDKVFKGLLKLIETFIIFTIIHTLFLLRDGASIINLLHIPHWTHWYLLSLIYWRLFLYILPLSIRNNYLKLLFLSVALCFVMGWVPIGAAFSFHRTFSFLPFFILGYVAAQTGTINRIKLSPILAFVILTAVFWVYFEIPRISTLLLQHYGYFRHSIIYGFPPLYFLLFRIGWLFFAGLMSVCFLSVVPRKEYRWTHFGQLTLFIYMYHSVILLCFRIIRKEYGVPMSFPYCVLYTIIVFCIIYIMSKVKFFHWLLNPVTPVIYNSKK